MKPVETNGGNSFGRRPAWLGVYAAAVYGFLYLPIVVLVVYSFNGPGVGGFPPRALTLDWYRQLF
jgi:spermidine/putrescine transport system permease protein